MQWNASFGRHLGDFTGRGSGFDRHIHNALAKAHRMIDPPIASACYRKAAHQDQNKKITQSPSPLHGQNRIIVQGLLMKKVP